MVVEATVCHIIRGRRLLLKKANRGISKGKWNGPGGKIEPGETPEENAMREVFEETGLEVWNPFYHGKLLFYMDGKRKLGIRVHLFSTKEFTGTPRSSEEGEVRWFPVDKLPLDDMWDDDRYWIDSMLNLARFDARFYYDEENKLVVKYRMRVRGAESRRYR